MKYPFSDSVAKFKAGKKTFAELAYTDFPFDEDFANRLPAARAFDFDSIAKTVCAYRSSKEKRLLHSADALIISKKGEDTAETVDAHCMFCFIEFKNQDVENIQSVKDPSDNNLMMKAFDSLSICAMTFSREISMSELQRHAVFVVVYPKQDFSSRILAVLNELAADGEMPRPLWNLDKLCDAGFYAKVLTMDDEKFSREFPQGLLACEEQLEES